MKGIIYKYTNQFNAKVYIGQTNRPKQRMSEHRSHSKSNSRKVAFYNAIKKYGWDAFTYEVLEELEASTSIELSALLDERERFWIGQYDSRNKAKGYNESAGGPSRGACGVAIDMYSKNGELLDSFEDYHQIQDRFNCNPSTIYHALNTPDALFRGKYILCRHGDSFVYSGGKKSKHIYYQYDLLGNVIKIWNSVCDIEKELGYCSSTIVKCCIHPETYKSYKGFKWGRANKI